MLTENLLRMY